MPGTFSPRPRVSDPDMHHGTCVTHVPWCMLGSLTNGFPWSRSRGKTFPAFPAHAQPTTLRIWKEAHTLISVIGRLPDFLPGGMCWSSFIMCSRFASDAWSWREAKVKILVSFLSGVPDYFDRNKILSGYDLSHYQVPHCIKSFLLFCLICVYSSQFSILFWIMYLL